MAVNNPILPQLAEWTISLKPADIPQRIKDLCADQMFSVLGATASGRLTEDGDAAWAVHQKIDSSDEFPLLGGGTGDLTNALDLLAMWSMAQDYDDYMFMGHTGHSAIWASVLVGAMQGVDGEELLTCIAIANELGGRLGSSLLFGPHNGQMWVPIHRIAAAAVTSRLLGATVEQTTDAMAIALYDSNDPVFRGFMGPGSKVRSAAAATVAGVRAALLAKEGLDGAADILEHPQGFWARFTYVPLKGTFRGLGTSWATDTMSVKPYPGCAYVDTTVASVLQAMDAYQEKTGKPLAAEDIVNIKVDAGALTIGMNALSAGAVAEGVLSPVVVNFSIPLTVAVAVHNHGLTGADLTQAKLDENKNAINAIAAKVELKHNAHYSIALARAFDKCIPVYRWIRGIPIKKLLSLRGQMRQTMGDHVDSAVVTKGIGKTLTKDDRSFVLKLLGGIIFKSLRDNWKKVPYHGMALELVDFQEFRLYFPARAVIETKDGDQFRGECFDPPGVPHNGSIHEVSREKFRREGGRVIDYTSIEEIISGVSNWSLSPKQLLDKLSVAKV